MLVEKSAAELSELLSGGEVSAVEIAREYLDRIESINPSINAYITVDGERALEEAAESDGRRAKGEALSAFDGVPVAIKDNICTKGLRTTCGSLALGDFVPSYDATAYRKLREQGFVTLGKTNMDEFAMGSTTETSHFGVTRNPHNTDRVPGGSSGGSAAAVSALLAPLALGSDTGGSIRQPASFCGVVGIKPTYGRVSRFGLVSFASSLDQIGVFGRSVDDTALMLGAISGGDSADSTSIERPVDFAPGGLDGEVRGMVIGLPGEYFHGVAPCVKDAVMKVAGELEKRGAKIEPISLKYTEYAIPIFYLIATAEASSNLARYDGIAYGYRPSGAESLSELYLRARSESFGKEVKRRIILGTYALSSGYYDAYYLKALKGRTLVIDDFNKAFDKVDCILSPVATGTAFAIGEKVNDPLAMYISDLLTISANLAAIPGMSVPIGLDEAGLPIGLQIMAGHFEEKKILNCAKAIESFVEPLRPPL
ncbi:MAG TPA: Asp-tRNA(Asn)/Glu-tRNA(Gln) amidotransferase subunit GatA [Spirochaetota bacterium]|jgi:aspartyl-tRNA(Asn)/glutamyl-tRNA(Gln) amidotransferase subunit A|nr:Asp-tRNA(Asn)/Glu-tRNA(Gln) amidotransferase subunit GatA [Spirochaetota bacterium]OPZ36710.1 MAG: Glutamyl-tRNA(Gln) amidotransferase subunit A [Spirochaetes bacterium ADurb.BinA120]HNU92055.1 Asp-tRNA(Asn)/Glu-tRNA(Gln) amidotransferase subunit GatA [Spirochaetota bacterium]HPI15529.1 Asp-tRNA(Asn)/Glu-tRNA(Gln) amidotransferase subunit GatA [Spirochaetota bacterium]HPV98484.1 Asp-tRNA(Asn)/Glu-tRNA(Gln) amidotransferase subunit GatA [Spirochaetota bacterium]